MNDKKFKQHLKYGIYEIGQYISPDAYLKILKLSTLTKWGKDLLFYKESHNVVLPLENTILFLEPRKIYFRINYLFQM